MEAETHVSKGFAVEIPPGENVVLVSDLCLFSIGSQRYLNGFWWRAGNDLPLPLAREEALHHGGPASIVGAQEHGDEGSEAGRHLLFDFFGEGVSLQTQNQVVSALVCFLNRNKEREGCALE